MNNENRDRIFDVLAKLFENGHWRIYRNYMGMEFALELQSAKYNFIFQIELDDEAIQKILVELNESVSEHKQELEKLIENIRTDV